MQAWLDPAERSLGSRQLEGLDTVCAHSGASFSGWDHNAIPSASDSGRYHRLRHRSRFDPGVGDGVIGEHAVRKLRASGSETTASVRKLRFRPDRRAKRGP